MDSINRRTLTGARTSTAEGRRPGDLDLPFRGRRVIESGRVPEEAWWWGPTGVPKTGPPETRETSEAGEMTGEPHSVSVMDWNPKR